MMQRAYASPTLEQMDSASLQLASNHPAITFANFLEETARAVNHLVKETLQQVLPHHRPKVQGSLCPQQSLAFFCAQQTETKAFDTTVTMIWLCAFGDTSINVWLVPGED